jgi:hypothetical protein
MPYEDVKAKCFFCEATIEGNQRFMLAGKNLPTVTAGRVPKWLKEKPEHKWAWNGLGEYINGEHVEFLFYLCPEHQAQECYNKAFKWAQAEIDKAKEEKCQSQE